MANVLPRDALKGIRSSYRARFVLVGSLAAIVCGGIALLALAPAYAIVKAGHVASADPQTVSLPPSTDRDEVLRAQTLVRELQPVASSTIPVVQILEQVLAARPAGIVVLGFRYTHGTPDTVTVEGSAREREGINAYRAKLSEDPRFESISVPIGTLTGAEGGRFSITITGTF